MASPEGGDSGDFGGDERSGEEEVVVGRSIITCTDTTPQTPIRQVSQFCSRSKNFINDND